MIVMGGVDVITTDDDTGESVWRWLSFWCWWCEWCGWCRGGGECGFGDERSDDDDEDEEDDVGGDADDKEDEDDEGGAMVVGWLVAWLVLARGDGQMIVCSLSRADRRRGRLCGCVCDAGSMTVERICL